MPIRRSEPRAAKFSTVTVFFDAMVVTAFTSRPQCMIGTQISDILDEA
jgi:hypothetical protein